jgi:hypothetical protein
MTRMNKEFRDPPRLKPISTTIETTKNAKNNSDNIPLLNFKE